MRQALFYVTNRLIGVTSSFMYRIKPSCMKLIIHHSNQQAGRSFSRIIAGPCRCVSLYARLT